MATLGGCIMAGITVPGSVTLSATTNGGTTVVSVTPEDYDSIDSMLTELLLQLNSQRPVTAGAWTFSGFSAAGASPQLTIGVTAGTFSITWISTDLRDALGFNANIVAQASATGASAVRGIWQPQCTLSTLLRYRSAPLVSDARQTEGPTGFVVERVGNFKYVHSNVMWSHAPLRKVWRDSEIVANESLEQFLDDTKFGRGHSWFSVGARYTVTAHDGSIVGGTTAPRWKAVGFKNFEEIVKRAVPSWDGLWNVTFPRLVSDGT